MVLGTALRLVLYTFFYFAWLLFSRAQIGKDILYLQPE